MMETFYEECKDILKRQHAVHENTDQLKRNVSIQPHNTEQKNKISISDIFLQTYKFQ